MSARLRRLVAGGLAILAGLAVWFVRKAVFTELDRQQWAATHPFDSPPFSVARPGRWEWTYPRSAPLRQGEVQYRLLLTRHQDVPFDHYEREKMPLRLHVSVQREGPDRIPVDKNSFPQERPDTGSSYAVSGYSAAEVEHTIGTLHLDPSAAVHFTVDIQVADPVLDKAAPRLRVVGAYDYAALAHDGMLLLGRDALAAAMAVSLLGIGITSVWRARRVG